MRRRSCHGSPARAWYDGILLLCFHLGVPVDFLRDPSRRVRILGPCKRAAPHKNSISLLLNHGHRACTHLRMGFGSSLVKYACLIACFAVIRFIGSYSNSWVRSLYPSSEREREPYHVASWGLRLAFVPFSSGRVACQVKEGVVGKGRKEGEGDELTGFVVQTVGSRAYE